MKDQKTVEIPNHYAARLSELDCSMVVNVPPGGNWKNIPASIPSKRLTQIQESFAAGKGSRSTYYGRLRPNAPSYTINTYFSRPGNGCHIHYDFDGSQHRTLSHREAARLQSFPDTFIFGGSLTSVCQQIGNAVPPLLAYQIAKFSLPLVGQYVDIFAGAGGLSLGFKWAGWEPLVANDINKSYLETYSSNIHEETVLGDIREASVLQNIIQTAQSRRDEGRPLFILGGPPCQGFSTAGNKRSMQDERNWLFQQYKLLIKSINPSGFIFENVMGLLNMEKGQIFDMLKRELGEVSKQIHVFILRSEKYAIPQRRTRIFIVGDCIGGMKVEPPSEITMMPSTGSQLSLVSLPNAITVEEALSDLPNINAGEDGSWKSYKSPPLSLYQKFMRGYIEPAEYLDQVREGKNIAILHES